MVKLLFIFWLLINFFSKTYSDCLFDNFDELAHPIFTRSYGGYDVLADFKGTAINIEEGQYLNLHCPSELRDLRRRDNKFEWMEIQCINKQIQYSDNENTYKTIDNIYDHYHGISYNQPKFRCDKNVARFFKYRNSLCNHDGYLYGYTFSFANPINIILAEFCYDFNSFDTVYIHYVAGYRTNVLQKLVDLNPDGKTYYNITPMASIPGLSAEKIDSRFFSNGYYQTIRNYEIGELVPFGSIAADLRKYLGNEKANRIVWWSPLKNGNWEIYSQILQKISSRSTFEIFAGTSGATKNPHKDCDLDIMLTYKDGEKEKSVPLYIWNYIIPRNDYNNSFVVFGVNSPYLELKSDQDTRTIFCEDICDEIEWLKPLNRTRKMPGMGYIFCCKPDEVISYSIYIPHVKYPLDI